MARLVKMFRGETGSVPVKDNFGSVPNGTVEQDCLVVWPASDEHFGFIIDDQQLAELGYKHKFISYSPMRRYYKANGKKVFLEVVTAAQWIVIQKNREVILCFGKPSLDHNGVWVSRYGYRLYNGSPYVEDYKRSLRRLYPFGANK